MSSRDAAAAQFTGLCRELTRDWRQALDRRLKGFGLTNAQWLALHQLALSSEAPTQVELASRMGVEGPTIVRLLDRMEARGLVIRDADASDRRRKIIRLTVAACELLDPVERVGRDLRRDFLEGVSDADLATCIAVLAKIRRNQAVAAAAETSNGDAMKVA